MADTFYDRFYNWYFKTNESMETRIRICQRRLKIADVSATILLGMLVLEIISILLMLGDVNDIFVRTTVLIPLFMGLFSIYAFQEISVKLFYRTFQVAAAIYKIYAYLYNRFSDMAFLIPMMGTLVKAILFIFKMYLLWMAYVTWPIMMVCVWMFICIILWPVIWFFYRRGLRKRLSAVESGY